jgi:hypothetical protein
VAPTLPRRAGSSRPRVPRGGASTSWTRWLKVSGRHASYETASLSIPASSWPTERRSRFLKAPARRRPAQPPSFRAARPGGLIDSAHVRSGCTRGRRLSGLGTLRGGRPSKRYSEFRFPAQPRSCRSSHRLRCSGVASREVSRTGCGGQPPVLRHARRRRRLRQRLVCVRRRPQRREHSAQHGHRLHVVGADRDRSRPRAGDAAADPVRSRRLAVPNDRRRSS